MFEDDVDRLYQVVRNDEEQYSIWPADRPLPPGWHGTDVRARKERCLQHIAEVWTDLRPASLRAAVDEAADE